MKKRWFLKFTSIVLSLLMVISLLPQITLPASAGSGIWNGMTDITWYNGTDTGFTITTAEQLAGLAELVNGGNDFSGKTIMLGADIQLNDTTGWESWDGTYAGNQWIPIGNSTTFTFKGTFDGNYHTVSGIYTNTTDYYQGLFGFAYGTIQNTGVICASITTNKDYVGGIVGRTWGAVSNCYFKGSVHGNNFVGGISGYCLSAVTNCYAEGSVSGISNQAGGIIGYSYDSIKNCYYLGTVSGKSCVGGVTGDHSNGSIINCYHIGTVTGTVSMIGGVVGRLGSGAARNCYASGLVSGASNFGGVAGTNSGTISNCYWSITDAATRVGAVADDLTDAMNAVDMQTEAFTAVLNSNVTTLGDITLKPWDISPSENNGYPVLGEFISGTLAISGSTVCGATLTAVPNTTPSTNLSYQWEVSANGSTGWANAMGAGNNTAAYTISGADAAKYLRVRVSSVGSHGSIYSATSAQVPYTITLAKSGNTGTDAVSFDSVSSVSTVYAASGSVTVYYTLDSSGTQSNTIGYSGGSITQVTVPATSSSSYTVNGADASNGVIAITAAFSHVNYANITGTPTISVTNGYGGSSDQIKIGATLTATPNTTPSTNLSYQWEVSANGSTGWANATGAGNNTAVYTVHGTDAAKYLRVKVSSSDASSSVYSAASAQVPYTIMLAQSGNTGTDVISFDSASSVSTVYAASGPVTVYYTLDNSGTRSNTISYSGGSITQVTVPATGSSSYTVNGADASSGLIAITAAFSHVDYVDITGIPTISVTNGYGGSSDQIKIGATLTATPNTTPSTNLSYQWEVSADGSAGWANATGTGNNTAVYTVHSTDATKYLRVKVSSSDATSSVCSAASAQVPYTITLAKSGNTGTDETSFDSASSVSTVYSASGSVTIYYTLDSSGTRSDTLSYTGGAINQVAVPGTGSSSYTVNGADASNGLIAITAAFNHVDYVDITGTPTISVTNGYGGSSDQIKIGATLTATPNTTPSTNLSYQWEVSADGSTGWANATGAGNNTAVYTVDSANAAKYLRVKVTSSDATSSVCSAASAQVPYTITLAQTGNTGTDAVSFDTAPSVSTVYSASGSVTVYYTLDNSGTQSNTISYSGGTINQVTASGTGSSSYTVNGTDASNGVIAITAAFNHISFIGSISTPTTSNEVPVIVNGKSQTAGTSETITENGKTSTTVTVNTDKLEQLLETEGEGATVTIHVSDGSDKASGVLTGQMVKSMEDKDATLVVETGSATYTLPAEQIDIDDVAQQFGEDIDLSDIEVTVTISEPSDSTVQVVENSAEEGGFSLVVQAVEFTVECTYNGQTAEVTTYNAYVERTIEIPDGVNPNEITTAVVVDPDGTVRHVPTEIVEIDGKYYAVINSLTNSVYTLIYNPVAFADMEDHWAQDAVNNMASRKVINGYDDGTFRPEGDITRAEFAAMIVRALGLPEGLGENAFSDVDEDDWHCGYIETAAAYGIINGFEDGTFRPQDNITCEQAMTMTARAMAITKLEYTLTAVEIEQLLAGYSDMADASEYARESIAACLKTGVVADSNDYTLVAKEYITRAEVAVVVQGLLEKSELI